MEKRANRAPIEAEVTRVQDAVVEPIRIKVRLVVLILTESRQRNCLPPLGVTSVESKQMVVYNVAN